VDVLRGHGGVRPRFAAALERGEDLVVSSVVLHELAYGAWRSGRPASKLKELDVFLRRVRVEPFQAKDALEAGRLRAHLAAKGELAGAYDELMGAQALARGWTMVTSNLRHFLPIPNLPIVDWRRGEGILSAEERAELILELMKAKK